MVVWISALVAGLVGLGWLMKRNARKTIDTGEVSESWLREHRAEKRDTLSP